MISINIVVTCFKNENILTLLREYKNGKTITAAFICRCSSVYARTIRLQRTHLMQPSEDQQTSSLYKNKIQKEQIRTSLFVLTFYSYYTIFPLKRGVLLTGKAMKVVANLKINLNSSCFRLYDD